MTELKYITYAAIVICISVFATFQMTKHGYGSPTHVWLYCDMLGWWCKSP